ncbi:hypothetical protein [Lactiplantibacillus paraplantarum]|nr:hypothetical protein [Lactiplantibacillus paraplantarum]WEE34897.1 hypothetical protein PWO93_09170 [Lactiplantibacillus paraplantarum]
MTLIRDVGFFCGLVHQVGLMTHEPAGILELFNEEEIFKNNDGIS